MSSDVCEASNALYILPETIKKLSYLATACILALRSTSDRGILENVVREFCQAVKSEANKINQYCDCDDCDILKAKGHYFKLRSAITTVKLGLVDIAQKIDLQVSGGICSASPERYLRGLNKSDLECVMNGAYLALKDLPGCINNAHPKL